MNIQINPPLYLNEIGQRDNNEDSIFPLPGKGKSKDRLFLVCDGVGGSEKGEVASRLVCDAFSDYLFKNDPHRSGGKGKTNENKPTPAFFEEALRHVEAQMTKHIKINSNCHGMKTTLTFLWFHPTGVYIGWCGDSRVYQFRNGQILYRTKDHSLVSEMVKRGEITEAEAQWHPHSNVILRAVAGEHEPTDLDVHFTTDVLPGDVFLLCTDGVTENLTEVNLSELSSLGDLDMIFEQIKLFCDNFSRDNFAMYLLGVEKVINPPNPKNDAKNGKESTKDNANASKAIDNVEKKKNPITTAKVKKSGENNFLKFLAVGLTFFALIIGGISFKNYKNDEVTKTYLDKAVYFDQINKVDSALKYLKIVESREPDNKMVQENIVKVQTIINNSIKEDSLTVLYEREIAFIDNEINQLLMDTSIEAVAKSLDVVTLNRSKTIKRGVLEYHLDNHQIAFELLNNARFDTTLVSFLDIEAWNVLGSLYPQFVKDDSIAQSHSLHCKKMVLRLLNK